MLRRLSVPVALLLALFVGRAALAQGLPDARTGIVVQNPQAAAVSDATAILTNPAGLANIGGFELNLGASGSTFSLGRGEFDATVVQETFGVSLAGGMGLGVAPGTAPRARFTGAAAVGGGHSMTLGGALHGIVDLTGSDHMNWLVDVGTQLRPASWLALGLVAESLGAQELGPATARAGLSLRPFGEWLTLGLDARAVPGSRDLGSPAYTAGMTFVPAASARLDLGGFAVTLGASTQGLPNPALPGPVYALGGGIELNGEHVGLGLLGGADGLVAGAIPAAPFGFGAVRVRGSSVSWESVWPSTGRWLFLRLEDEGAPPEDTSNRLMDLFTERPGPMAVLAALDDAAQDSSVDGVVLRIDRLSLGWGRLAELRQAIMKLRQANKKVHVHLVEADDAEYFVASAADRITLAPAGTLDLNGVRAELTYFGDTLEKVGVQAEAISAGRYKSAPRALTANAPSPEELEVTNALLDGVYGALVDLIAEGRKLTPEAVRALIDRGGLSAQQALDAKLVDGLAYDDDLTTQAGELAGREVLLEGRFLEKTERAVRWDDPPRIALIPIEGSITMRPGFALFGGGDAAATDLVRAIDRAAKDPEIRAIVLRIDSPGGDALASDLIWHAVMKAREAKPVVASMGDVAASGGYYIASAAHTILAEPNTVTGSIGVFGLFFSAERLADDWGVRSTTVKRGALPSPGVLHPLTEAQKQAAQASVDATYDRFLEAVLKGRAEQSGLDKESLSAVASGRVWNGSQALERKLVDKMGGIVDAFEEAERRAGIAEGEEVGVDIFTGGGDALENLLGLEAALFPSRMGLERLAGALLGDPAAAAFLLEHEGRPLAVAPAKVRIR